ncbi:hypothetical protein BDV95DRAFT_160971 [Massariosphaeria phaeospora]|uniref:BZIP domain-containing protein n=1 Tax=Massariosphaeria phaeospora TaxID=100035 RepID=A0A7C8M5S8_9PLEO|nr:hypothetical protein BDV95DRAFT_160971 [Massariosphaeria phaeospora]
MALDTSASMDWAHLAYVTLNAGGPGDKWPPYSSAHQPHFPSTAFTVAPALLTQATVERHGQVTPPDDLSPADTCDRRDSFREGSVPLDQLRNETSWPANGQFQALQDYQPMPSSSLEHPESLEQSDLQRSPEERTPKRRRTRRSTEVQHRAESETRYLAPPTASPTNDAEPPKRKRGRPKSQPQVAYTQDGFPIQVSSARENHLEKNRVAAHKCRQRKKEYVSGLEERARELTGKNKSLKDNVAVLRDEVLSLKNEVLRHAGCGFWAVDEYLARCAGNLLGMPRGTTPASKPNSQTMSPAMSNMSPGQLDRASSASHMPRQHAMDSPEDDELDFDMLNNFDEKPEHTE